MQYNFKVQHLAEGTEGGGIQPPEVIIECSFNAPSTKEADIIAERIAALVRELSLAESYRPYEDVKNWK